MSSLLSHRGCTPTTIRIRQAVAWGDNSPDRRCFVSEHRPRTANTDVQLGQRYPRYVESLNERNIALRRALVKAVVAIATVVIVATTLLSWIERIDMPRAFMLVVRMLGGNNSLLDLDCPEFLTGWDEL